VYRRVGPALSATLAIWVTILFYREGFTNYYMIGFCLSIYWALFEFKGAFREILPLAALISGFFCFLTVADVAYWNSRYIFYIPNIYSLVQFLFGAAVLAGLGWFTYRPSRQGPLPAQ
jgi:hypothetical protein